MTYPPGRSVVAGLLVAAGAFIAWLAWDERRIGRFAVGIAGIGVGVCGLIVRTFGVDEVVLLACAAVALPVVYIVILAQRALQETR